MELSEKAAGALAVLRRDGRSLRFTVEEVCETGSYRLSVRYTGSDGHPVRVGLVYSGDRDGLERLRARLEAEGR